jgi:hypothetical protein
MMHISRRSLMHSAAGLVVAFCLPRTAEASATTVAADSVDAFLAIAPDGGVTVFAGKVDLGTGARAAIRQIVAEELAVSPGRIALVEGDTALTPDQGSTGGSTGIMVGGVQIRQAAATARARPLTLAATQLRRQVDDLEVRDGAVVIRGSNEQVNFAALIGSGAARAGGSGKGFAIVAQEVKALASETAKATQVIRDKTAEIQGVTERSANAIVAILDTVRELNLLSARIATAIDQQASATREIAQSVEATAAGVGAVANSFGDIETMADETADATTVIRHSAAELVAHTGSIQRRIKSFTERVRAAQA